MKKILLPVDFTDVSINAIRYAAEMFSDQEIVLIHVKTGLVQTNDPMILRMNTTHEEFWVEALKNFIKKEIGEKLFSRISDCVVKYGNIVDEITDYAKENKFDFICMGTKDKYSLFEKWFGTISLGIIKLSEVSVYAIPKYAKYSGFERVLVGLDKNHIHTSSFDHLVEWNTEYKAFIKFINVKKSSTDNFTQEKEDLVEKLFKDKDPDFSFELMSVVDRNIAQALMGYAYNSECDLITILPDSQKYVDALFFQSVSKDLILDSKIAMLFLK